jgi:hypothetical protein
MPITVAAKVFGSYIAMLMFAYYCHFSIIFNYFLVIFFVFLQVFTDSFFLWCLLLAFRLSLLCWFDDACLTGFFYAWLFSFLFLFLCMLMIVLPIIADGACAANLIVISIPCLFVMVMAFDACLICYANACLLLFCWLLPMMLANLTWFAFWFHDCLWFSLLSMLA